MSSTTRKHIEEFRRLLKKGSIQEGYRAVLSYIAGLRSHFERSAGLAVSGLYQGAMDMSYFAVFPPSLRRRNLKIAIVFDYDAFRFEAWLAGRNRQVQRQYWELIKEGQWPSYRISAPGKGVDSILEYDLVANVDLDDPGALTATIEAKTKSFIHDIETFLSGKRLPRPA